MTNEAFQERGLSKILGSRWFSFYQHRPGFGGQLEHSIRGFTLWYHVQAPLYHSVVSHSRVVQCRSARSPIPLRLLDPAISARLPAVMIGPSSVLTHVSLTFSASPSSIAVFFVFSMSPALSPIPQMRQDYSVSHPKCDGN